MRNSTSLAILLVTLLIGTAAGFFIRHVLELSSEKKPTMTVLGDDTPALDHALNNELALLRAQVSELQRQLATARTHTKASTKPKATPVATPATRKSARLPFKLASLDDADPIYEAAMDRLDIQKLLDLSAVLLSMGEEGYAKWLDLFDAFLKEGQEDRSFGMLFDDEIQAGRCLRAVADNHENLLKFSSYLIQQDPESLPRPLREIRRELSDELGTILLGFYGGGIKEVDDAYFGLFREKLEVEPRQGNYDRDAIRGVAQLKTEEATDLLLDLMEGASPSSLRTIVMALAFQGNKRALPGLRELRENTQDEKVLLAIDTALRQME